MCQKDDFFGNVPFIDLGHEPLNATITASKNLEFHKLDADNLQSEYEGLPNTFRSIVDNVSQCVSVTTGLVNEGWKRCFKKIDTNGKHLSETGS